MSILVQANKNPVVVFAIVLVAIVSGLISLFFLPVTLFPEIERPSMVVNTTWRAASPAEVEAEIIEPQEQILKGIANLEEVTATAFAGGSRIKLVFKLGTDMDEALVDVMGRLARVRKRPVDAFPPVIDTSSPSDSLVFMFVQYTGNDGRDIDVFEDEINTWIVPWLEDIDGVASSELFISSDRQLEIAVDSFALASYGLTLEDVIAGVRGMDNFSGGFIPVNSKQFSLRFEGEQRVNEVGAIVLSKARGRLIRLQDVATIEETRGRKRHFVIQNGHSAVGIKLMRSKGASVLDTLMRVNEALVGINERVHPMNLHVELSFDPSVFIVRAISFVTSNLALGIVLAALMLFWFIRHAGLSLLITLSIPISFIVNFLVLYLAGRTLNVISLAGLAFASGIILDAGIVVLESIQSQLRRQQGQANKSKAIIEGVLAVKSALFASTATTLIIFFPIFLLEDVEGQLFADLAIAIIICVLVSLALSLTLLPVLSRYVLGDKPLPASAVTIRLGQLASQIAEKTATRQQQLVWVAGLTAISLASVLMLPKVDYMPAVKRDALDTIMKFPAGSNMAFIEQSLAMPIAQRLNAYLDGSKTPELKNYYVVVSPGYNGLAIRTKDPADLNAFKAVIKDEILADLPGTSGFVMQGALFGSFNSTRSLGVNVYADDYEDLVLATQQVAAAIKGLGEGYNTRISPSPDNQVIEYRVEPNLERLGELGISLAEAGHYIQALGEGVYVGEQFDGLNNLNIIVTNRSAITTSQLAQMPVATREAGVIALGEIVHLTEVSVPQQIQRIDQKSALTITVYPPEQVSLTELANDIITLGDKLALPGDASIKLSSASDKLNKALNTLLYAFAVAAFFLVALLAILFARIKDALLVTLLLPFACVGGIWALAIANLIVMVNLDLLTVMGFIILLGLVVNNAILLVDQCRTEQQQGVDLTTAANRALASRIQPVMLTSITSVAGMLPLAIIPGPGSEIYRGLAIVIVGGMTVSTLFSLVLMPCLLKLAGSKDLLLKNESNNEVEESAGLDSSLIRSNEARS